MKKVYNVKHVVLAIAFIATCFNAIDTFAQNVTVSPGAGSYPTLADAFAAINAGTHTGAITVTVTGNTTETVSAVLNASGTGSASYTSILIQPSGTRTVSGAISTNLIDLDGADFVTINGLNAAGNSLTIDNSATGASNTIRLINDATNNLITNCTLLGAASTLQNGVVFFSTGITTGNDNNTISNCNIGGSGANQPINSIFSLGTSATVANSGNTIASNNIFDFFSAASTSIGIHLNATNSGNNAWTITNNRLYQTAPRTYTTANTHQGIFVGTGTGYTISGNLIGAASSTGSGTYTMNSTVATRFVAIGLGLTAGAPVSSVQNNTVYSLTISTSSGASTTNGVLCGINITSGDVNVGTVTGNTIGSMSSTNSLVATPTTTQGAVVGINCSSTGTINISNNQMGGFTSAGATAAVAGGIFGIIVSGVTTSMTIANNTIGSTLAENMRAGVSGTTTGSSVCAGIFASSSATTLLVSDNTIQNLASYGSGTASYVRGMFTATTGSSASTVTRNTIKNLTTLSGLTGLTSGNCSALGIHLASGVNAVVSDNTVFNISNINTATTNLIVVGISLAQATNTTVSRNRIYNLSNAGTGTTATSPPIVAGIAIRSGTTGITVDNNMISIGNGQSTNTAFVGIWSNHGSTPDPVVNLFHNSVNISGTAASGALSSFGFLRGDFSATARTVTVNIKNNIFENVRSGGTGGHYAISNNFGATTASATGWAANASNFNVLNANPATVAYWTSAQTLAGWQAISAGDGNSLSGVAISYTDAATADLHINSTLSPIESAGTPSFTTTVDFDNQTRNSFTPVDLGADAGNFITSPIISFTPVANQCFGGSGVVLATSITDVDGVPTSGSGLPVLYWSLNGGPYTAVTAVHGGGSNYTFSFAAGAPNFSTITYYIVAQDNLGNVGSNPSFGAGGFSINPPAAATPPSIPGSFNVSSLAGTYTVGVGGDFTTLTAAASAYAVSCLNGPVVFSLTDATYPSETFPIVFNANPAASSTNTLTVKPTGTTTISATSATAILILNAADYIIIDGSNGSVANTVCPSSAATRDLTITNTSTSTASGVVWLASGGTGNGVTNCTVQNCNINGSGPAATIVALGAGGTVIGTGGADNDNIRFINNDVRAAQFGIYSAGTSAVNKNETLVINQNLLNAPAPSNIGVTGIYVALSNDITVSGNSVDNIIRTGSPDAAGINLGMGAVNGISATTTGIADGIGNAIVTNNKVGAITNTGTFAAVGIAMGNTVSGTQLIANNMISGVAANGTAGDIAAGIWLAGGTGNTSVLHNTVVMQGVQNGATAGNQTSTALGVISASSALTVRNNILVNTQGSGAAGTTTRYTAIALGYASPYTGLLSNNNVLFAAGAGPGAYTTGITGGVAAGTSRVTLADWQTETSQDAASLSVAPVFVSSTDLHLDAAGNTALTCAGTQTSVNNDIDCSNRRPTPTLGADELSIGLSATIAVSETSGVVNDGFICAGSAATLSATATGATAPTYLWSTSATTSSVLVTAAGTYTVTVTDSGCAVTATFTISVNPSPTATISGTTSACPGTTVTLTAGGGISYLWGTNETTQSINVVMPGAPSAIGLTVTDANGCVGTTSQSLIPLPVASITNTLTEPTTCVTSDGAINISVTNVTPSTYAWTTSGTGSIPAGQEDDEDISGLTAGTYTVVVTGTNGCTSSAIFTLGIPGGCATCPIIGDVSVSTPRCTNIPVTLTASGLSNLGATYGINFVSFPTTTSNPYTGGTVVATVTNGALTSGGAVASTTATLAAGFQYIYAVLTPTPTDPSCRPSDTTSIVVSTPPVPTITVTETSGFANNDGIICQGSSATLTASGGTSYAWSTTAITPAITVNATGTYTVTVTNAGGCTATATRTITVNPLPNTFTITGGGSRCTTDGGLPVGLSGSQLNVNYQLLINNAPAGAPVAGTGNAIAFPVQTTGGTYTVVATSTGGCTSSMTGTVTISTVNCGSSIADPCTCLNNATTLTNGQFGEVIEVNAPAGQTWTVTAVSGLFTTTSAAPPAAPTAITVGTTMTYNGTRYVLGGRHVDAIGYSITVSNGLGTSLSIGNSCAYPNPTITSNLTVPFCLYSDPVTLTGNPGDANIVSQGFTVNGVPATTFNPGAGIGQYTIVYTVNGGVPKAAGANDPGCIQSVSTIVAVVASPTTVNCNNLVQVSLDADCSVEVTPDMILEGSYACFDDYEVSIDRTVPLGNGPWATPVVLGVNDIGKTWAVKVTHLVGGNSCWGLIKVEDKMAPVVTCNTIAISCAETNTDPAYLANVLGITNAFPTVVENCSSVTYSHNDVWTDLECPTSPTASSITGYITRTWIVTDASGNTASCTQTINVVGARVYGVNFPADAIISCSANVNTSPSATGVPFITFNYPSGPKNYPIWPGSNYCELQTTYSDQLIPVCDGTYKILRTWTAYDWCLPTSPFPPTSNPQYYVQLVKVVDETGPSIEAIDDVVASTNANTCCATVDLPNVIVGDACSRIASAVATIYGYDQYTGDLIGTFTVNGSLTTFPGNNLWTPDTLAAFGFTPCLPIGTHEVIYTITDDCGNSSTYSFDLTVEDQTPPQVAADEWTQISIGVDGMAFINAETFDDGSYDNCGPVYFKARRMDNNPCQLTDRFHPQVKFCCEDIGDTIMVIFRVYDVDPGAGTTGLEEFDGHYSDVMVQVLVEDKLKPVCVAPANVTVSCEAFDPSLWAYGQATATDNCSNPTITGTVVYTQFDSLCNKGTITRRWTAVDAGGNTSQCTQRIIVTYNQNYWVKFPADRLVSTCDGTTAYGAPEFYGEDCELLATSYTDEFFTVIPDACYKIERTWRVINWCTYNPNNATCQFVPNPNPNNTTNHPTNLPGVTVSPLGTTVPGWAPTVVRINPSDPQPTNYSTFWNKETNCYTYKQIIKVFDTQDPTVSPAPTEFCDLSANDPQFYNAMQYWDAGIASHDLCEGDANIELTATDACSGAALNFRYLLFLDLDGNGSMETVVNSVAPLAYNTLFYDNATAVNFVGGTPWNFDFRPVPNDRKWAFGLQVDNANGNSRTARVRWVNQVGQNAVPQLPYGNHKIKWFVEDGCGNETVYEHAIVVKDCKKPTVVCLNGLSVNLMNVDGGMIALWASDFLQYTEDNCTPANLIKIGIRRVGQADGQGNTTGFPKNADGTPQTGVNFTCADLGTQLVELWGLDVAGNADYCETYVLIQDNAGVCGTNANIAGALKTEEIEGVEDANVELDGSANGVPVFSEVFSQVTGDYAFSNALPYAGNATVTPTMELDPLNGVNTWDLILISRHILGLEPLNTPYKLIAADANKSGTVTTFDIVELRKLILGTYQQLPNNSSWRFVDKTQVFTNDANPFADVIRENIQIANIQNHVSNGDFVAAKIGDVDGTATPNNLVASDDRTAGTLLFDIQDRAVTVGETLVVSFTADQVVKGYQYTMNLNGLKVETIEGSEMSTENFAIFDNAITTSWDAPTVFNGKATYTVTFTATKSGKLSEMLSVSSRITKALAFDGASKLNVAFRFNNGGNSTIAGVGFELYQNAPNPFVNKTFVGFHLPEATSATLSVYDETGRVLYTTTGDFGKGYNAISLDRTTLNANGVLYYKLETSTDSATKKMIQTSK